MFQRRHYRVLLDRLKNEKRHFIQVLTGPRQVGKSTVAQSIKDSFSDRAHYVSCDSVAQLNSQWVEQQWNISRLKIKKNGLTEFLLIIDEIQKIKNWSDYIKREWDADSRNGINIKLLLLGSSAMLLQQGLSESLAGRYELTRMGHWSFNEINELHELSPDEYIYYGSYPASMHLLKDEKRWKNYIRDSLIESSLSKDILYLTRVDKPAVLRQLFELGCLHSGQIVSYTKILGQLQDAGNTTTTAHYLKLLEGSGMLAGINKYSGNVIRQRASSPKYQVFNMALMSALSNTSFYDIQEDRTRWGQWVESAVGAQLLNASYENGYKLFYWRKGLHEVDYILTWEERTIAIEVKSGRGKLGMGMHTFKQQFQPDRVYLIGDNGLPLSDFFRMNIEDLF